MLVQEEFHLLLLYASLWWAGPRAAAQSNDSKTLSLLLGNVNISLGDSPLPLVKTPKILGVTLDPQLTFGPHAKKVVEKAASRLKVIKAVAGTDWGSSSEDLLLTYKAIGSTVIDYAAPVFSPNLKPSNVLKIQRVQNQCLRVVTGSHSAASLEHLHHETKTLPVSDHLQMLSRQFLASAFSEQHPSHRIVTAQQGPRNLRHTLTSKHKSTVVPFLRNGILPPESRQTVINDLHTAAVSVAIQGMDKNPNRVLGSRPPQVNKSESSLPRHWRSTLSQLRSGFCRCLRSYKAVVDQLGSTICPECNAEEHTVSHLFQCAAKPTTLYKLDLWVNPLHVAFFLSLLSSFIHLPRIPAPSSPLLPHPVLHRPPPPPPSPPPLPRPPPEPPP